MESKKSQHVWWGLGLVLIIVSIVIMSFSNDKCINICVAVLMPIISSLLLYAVYSNEKEKFVEDSWHICLPYSLPTIFWILISLIGLSKNTRKYLKKYTFFSLILIFCLWICILIVYYFRCRKVIKEIRKDMTLFNGKMIESTLATILVFSAATIFVISFPGDNNVKVGAALGIGNYASLTNQLLNIFINCNILFMKMFNYVRSEINEFDKQEEEKVDKEKKEKLDEQKYEMDKKEHSEVNETDVLNKETKGKNKEKIQYYDVEEFVKKLGTKRELNKLKNKIKKRKKKLRKEQFSDCKRFVNEFATLEDLDNLEKIIPKKRKKKKVKP